MEMWMDDDDVCVVLLLTVDSPASPFRAVLVLKGRE